MIHDYEVQGLEVYGLETGLECIDEDNIYQDDYYRTYDEIIIAELENNMTKPKLIVTDDPADFCKDCGGNEYYEWMAQTRGGDEGMTTFRQCKCGKRCKF